MFSKFEQKVIQEKFEQLEKVKNGSFSGQELVDLITQRRITWAREHLEEMLTKYQGLSPLEQAYRIIYFEHMKINPQHSQMEQISPNKIKIKSYNFCPYLEACIKLDLDTRFVCKEIGEHSIQKVCQMIHPQLKFSRNYKKIRPHHRGFCEEYLELIF